MERDEIERFLAEFERRLRLLPVDRERVVAEFRAHLEEAIAAEERAGTSYPAAIRNVLARVRAPAAIAKQYRPHGTFFNGAVSLGALACGLVAAWPFVIAASVVPERDPSRVVFWNAVAVGFLGYALLTVAYLRLAPRSAAAAGAVLIASAMAVASGVLFAVPMLTTSGDFEGYIVLMGVVLGGQGLVVAAQVLSAALGRRFAR